MELNPRKLARCWSLKTISIIKKNLHKENLKAFKKSCFGHLLEMKPLSFQGRLLHHLLLQIDTAASKNTNTLIFNISNSTIKFQPKDFESITGLPLATSEASIRTACSRIHKDVFGGKQRILFKHVKKAFLDACRDHKGGGEVTLKLALLYFLFGVILPGSHMKKIELRYLHLLDNLPLFRSFPWGRAGHEYLVSSVLSARQRLDDSSSTRLAIAGFTSALQVWAYENMPSLAMLCEAARVRSLATPSILRWSSTKRLEYKLCFRLGVGVDGDGDGDEERQQTQSEEEDEEVVKEATPARHSAFGSDPVSTNKPQSSLTESERNRALLELVFDDSPDLYTPQPLWKTHSEFEISEDEYGRSKALYEMLLERTQRVEMWISYAQFEAFAVIQGSEIGDRRNRLERGRRVFERGLSYFRRLKEERKMLLEEWFDVEYRFGEIGDVGSIRAKLPQKLKKKRRVRTEDGSTRHEDYIDYIFPKEKDVRILKKHKTCADSD